VEHRLTNSVASFSVLTIPRSMPASSESPTANLDPLFFYIIPYPFLKAAAPNFPFMNAENLSQSTSWKSYVSLDEATEGVLATELLPDPAVFDSSSSSSLSALAL